VLSAVAVTKAAIALATWAVLVVDWVYLLGHGTFPRRHVHKFEMAFEAKKYLEKYNMLIHTIILHYLRCNVTDTMYNMTSFPYFTLVLFLNYTTAIIYHP
jgi:hypothetical protein